MDGFGFGWLLKMLNMCGWIQLVHQIPKDIEGNEVQISSTTSMLGRQLEDIEAVPVTFDDPTHTQTYGRHFAEINYSVLSRERLLENPYILYWHLGSGVKIIFFLGDAPYNLYISHYFPLKHHLNHLMNAKTCVNLKPDIRFISFYVSFN